MLGTKTSMRYSPWRPTARVGLRTRLLAIQRDAGRLERVERQRQALGLDPHVQVHAARRARLSPRAVGDDAAEASEWGGHRVLPAGAAPMPPPRRAASGLRLRERTGDPVAPG